MGVLGSPGPSGSPLYLLPPDAAAAVRRRRAAPEFWLQLHLGFLCEERQRETRRVSTRWQAGRQPGDWAWLQFEEAVRFMGGLEPGQGQVAVLSTWAPAWTSRVEDIEAFDVGVSTAEYLPATCCWWAEAESVPDVLRLAQPGAPASRVWRLGAARQHKDTDPRAWHPAT